MCEEDKGKIKKKKEKWQKVERTTKALIIFRV
jgi:hypothetical protein